VVEPSVGGITTTAKGINTKINRKIMKGIRKSSSKKNNKRTKPEGGGIEIKKDNRQRLPCSPKVRQKLRLGRSAGPGRARVKEKKYKRETKGGGKRGGKKKTINSGGVNAQHHKEEEWSEDKTYGASWGKKYWGHLEHKTKKKKNKFVSKV